MLGLDYVVLYWQVQWIFGRILNRNFSLSDVGVLFYFSTYGWKISKQDGLFIPIECRGWHSPVPPQVINMDQHQEIPRYIQSYRQACAEEAPFSQLAEIPYTKEFWIQCFLIAFLCKQLGNHTGELDDSCRDRVTSQLKELSKQLNTKPQYASSHVAVMS